eukprot:g2377.t1
MATIEWMEGRGVEPPTWRVLTAIHVAIAFRNDSLAKNESLFFVEATPEKGVTLTPDEDFRKSYPEDTNLYHGRLEDANAQMGKKAADVAREQIGKPYANEFQHPPDSFYCSSLVTYAYEKASGLANVFEIPGTFDLIFVPRSYWEAYYARLNETLPPPNTTGSNPTLLLMSPAVRLLF